MGCHCFLHRVVRSGVKEYACRCRRCRRCRFHSRTGKIPREENGNPLQYSCLGNPTNREAWWASVHGLDKSRTPLKQLNGHTQRGRGCSSLASPRLLPTAEFTCPLTIYQQTYKVIVARAVFSVRIRVSLLTQFSSQPCRVSVKVLLCV